MGPLGWHRVSHGTPGVAQGIPGVGLSHVTPGIAQGGSNSDPGAIRRAAKIESRGKFNEEAALFGAGEQAAGLRNKGRAARFQGRMARNQGIMQSAGNFLSGGEDLMSAGKNMLKVFGG